MSFVNLVLSWKRIPTVCLIVIGVVFGTNSLQGAERVFRAGAYAMEITPPKYPISVNGGMRDHFATGAHDPLHARCLVLDDGTTKIALVACDSCMILRPVHDSAREQAMKLTGIPGSNILVSATHTHSAPSSANVFQSDADPDYMVFLAERIAAGIAKAHEQLEPAQIGWGVGENPDQVFNRRWKLKPGVTNTDPFDRRTDVVQMNPGNGNLNKDVPAGPIDPKVTVLSVQAIDGRPIAAYANYSLHYVGGVSGDLVSADYYGVFADLLTQKIGATQVTPPFVGIMSNGTSGDINNVNYSLAKLPSRGEFEQIRLVAESVSQTAADAYAKIEHQKWVPLGVAERELQLGVRKPDANEIVRAEKLVADAKAASKDQLSTLQEIYARESLKLQDYPERVPVRLQAIRIGELGITAIPCEVFVEIGLELKAMSPFPTTLNVSLANGYNGYLPTAQQHSWGGYETWRARSSYLETTAANKITANLLPMLLELSGSK
ncbi:MAG: neutral/alkaline non-lysosomal ceramidase N-terminal domain-containing protein [Planctomycetaceae bacterium]|nr:neutral/alkaline non-lysosomal ceramidase N-terminal domain-containing protein [Planctomycetaceae bacterium]